MVQHDDWKKDTAARPIENIYPNSADTRRLMVARFVGLTAVPRGLGFAKEMMHFECRELRHNSRSAYVVQGRRESAEIAGDTAIFGAPLSVTAI